MSNARISAVPATETGLLLPAVASVPALVTRTRKGAIRTVKIPLG